nr:uncharacterized protein LOC119620694 isoform X1 [Chlorocebus sabaeus]
MTEEGLGSGHFRVPCSKGTGGVRRGQKSGRRWWQTEPGRGCACARQPATVRPRTTARAWERQQSAPSAWERRGPLAPASSASNLQATLSPQARPNRIFLTSPHLLDPGAGCSQVPCSPEEPASVSKVLKDTSGRAFGLWSACRPRWSLPVGAP